MKKLMAVAGWALRASALICMVWIFAQVLGGKITALPVLLGSVAWHAGFALSGVALVGASREARNVAAGVEDADASAA